MNEQTRNEIVHRCLRGQSQREIAKQLHVSRNTIKAVLEDLHKAREGPGMHLDRPRVATKRSSLLDPYETELKELLARYPDIPVVQVQQRLQEVGCEASYTVLRQRVKLIRQSLSRGDFEPADAPGAVARVAFRDAEYDCVSDGRRRMCLFVFRLAYSRRLYLHFASRRDLAATIHEHVCAFEQFGGVAASIEYDNVPVTDQTVLDGDPDFHPTFLRFASHYGFRPTRCRETDSDDACLMRRIRDEVLNERPYRSLDHVNDAMLTWFSNVVQDRTAHKTQENERVQQESAHLIALPNNAWCG